mmetsp:Transcript_19284/g.51260  ORF Transcript_19284/g.51260 Transcript_19284/m.51260 type:complete len:108 (-) Transcript_19284:34-357(-)
MARQLFAMKSHVCLTWVEICWPGRLTRCEFVPSVALCLGCSRVIRQVWRMPRHPMHPFAAIFLRALYTRMLLFCFRLVSRSRSFRKARVKAWLGQVKPYDGGCTDLV